MPNQNSFFKEQELPKYQIQKKIRDQEIEFNITFNMLTVNYDYPAYEKKFAGRRINNVLFTVNDDHKLTINVTHAQKFSADTDLEFRKALGKAGLHNLQSVEVDDILKNYNQFLEDNAFTPPKSSIRNWP